jgi:spermidine synthase
MTVTAIQIGLDPDVIDYSSSDFAQFPGLSKEKLRAANDDNVAALRAAGYHVDSCLIDFGDAGADKARQWLEAKRYDAVLIGAGVRLVAANTLLFEAIVNAAHVSQPDCRFVFNRAAVATPDDICRWYPNPEAVA